MLRIVRLLVLALLALPVGVSAQSFPDKRIRVVVPFAPGGGTDILVRILAPEVGRILGQQLLIDNRPGGASVIGTDIVVKADADGYTILASDSTFLINPGLMNQLPFDELHDFTGITMLASAPVILVVHPSLPARSLGELVALAKAKPGALNFGSGGFGASTHLAGELLKQAAGIDLVHVPYKGTAPVMNDLLAGQVQIAFSGISTSRQYVEVGQLRALALTGAQRNPAMPDVPTFAELGLPGVEASSYWGLYAPAGTPKDVVTALNAAFVRALQNPVTAERLRALGYEPIGNTADLHTAQMRRMIGQWTEVIRRANIKSE